MTRLLRWMTLGALIGILLLAAPLTARAADPMSGTWVLNVQNSMFEPGPAPRSAKRTQQIVDETITLTYDLVAADGTPAQITYSARIDGDDHPMTGVPNADTIAFKRIDARTLEFTAKKGGKVTATGKHRVSEDGTELEIAIEGKNAQGEEFSDLSVFDKR